jgi:hypothetical protein
LQTLDDRFLHFVKAQYFGRGGGNQLEYQQIVA